MARTREGGSCWGHRLLGPPSRETLIKFPKLWATSKFKQIKCAVKISLYLRAAWRSKHLVHAQNNNVRGEDLCKGGTRMKNEISCRVWTTTSSLLLFCIVVPRGEKLSQICTKDPLFWGCGSHQQGGALVCMFDLKDFFLLPSFKAGCFIERFGFKMW